MRNHLPVGEIRQQQFWNPMKTADWLFFTKYMNYFLWKTVSYAFITMEKHKQSVPFQQIFPHRFCLGRKGSSREAQCKMPRPKAICVSRPFTQAEVLSSPLAHGLWQHYF